MEKVVYGSLNTQGIEVVIREGRYLVRYDAGAHQEAWREDEITPSEFTRLSAGGNTENEVMFEIQRRLEKSGVKPYVSNWTPKKA
ncbi:hypothetical protein F3I62_15335 [Pseudomonas sp. R-28-1W-6]|uniref:hypothetical protein n=1 Tax=Pseudomonas sp. R-28-1W-6 TaxID=2650101 RepID=UPI00136617FF|nr:hypothetical protein [Pseudomonas sp. R-28-1W-6]MWV13476.1 hypothetical protein [Pseudomonas sp. R-28-1W-6]